MKKILLATSIYIFVNWRKILQISIIPLIFTIPFLFYFEDFVNILQNFTTQMRIESNLTNEDIMQYDVENNNSYILLFLLLLIYAYTLLSINLLKMFIFGANKVNISSSLLEFKKIFKYIFFNIIINTIIIIISYFMNIFFIILAYFIIVPIMLNFVNIAIGEKIKISWKLSFTDHFNLFFMQILLPYIVVMIVGLAFQGNIYISFILQVIIFYWTTINIAIFYQTINAKNNINNYS